MTITDDLVEAFLKCPTKCFLRSRGEAGTGNVYAAWARTKNDVFRIEGTKRLVAEVTPDKCAIGTQAMGSLKPAAWHLGIDLAVQSQELEILGRLGIDKKQSRKLALDYTTADVTPHVMELFRFAAKLTRQPGEIEKPDFDRIRQAGWSDAAILETVLVTSLYACANRFSAGIGLIADF